MIDQDNEEENEPVGTLYPRTATHSRPRPVAAVLVLLLPAIAFLCIAWTDDRAQRAWYAETSGLTRGAMVDRMGRTLAVTKGSDSKALRALMLPSLATSLGYRTATGGWTGLERKYNDLLTARHARRDPRSFFLRLGGNPVRGDELQLTLDRRVQEAAQHAIAGKQGAIVALDPNTGGVLAYATSPYCPPSADRNSPACPNGSKGQALDRVRDLLVPPGSIFKIVTLTAALDTGRFSPTSIFSGADAFGPNPLWDNTQYPSNVTRSDLTSLTLFQALAFSDNFTFGHIGLTLGADTLLRYAHRYLIGSSVPFDYPVLPSVIANGKSSPSPSELAQASFGAGVDRVTPLQMALIAATVANGGTMMAPHLVQAQLSPTGHVIRQYADRSLGRVMTRGAAAQVTQGMEFVVDHGSGFKAQIRGIRVAGKTGTADSGQNKPNAWFIAFAPADHPVIAVAVINQFTGEGFEYAAPLARDVLIAALQARGLHVH